MLTAKGLTCECLDGRCGKDAVTTAALVAALAACGTGKRHPDAKRQRARKRRDLEMRRARALKFGGVA